MLTPDELHSLNINPAIAREALVQAEKRLGDALEAKKNVEQKATVLFGAYVTISLALYGFGGSLLKDAVSAGDAWPYFIAGTLFVVGAASFAAVFRSAMYGTLGSHPDMWLVGGRIDGGEPALAHMLAFLTYFHAARIKDSNASNARKSRFLHAGMMLGLFGATALLVTVASTYWVSSHP